MNKKWVEYCLLAAIFILALLFRTIILSTIPNGLNQDELNAGYQGYKIIKTGSDLYGNILPYYINRFGDFRPAGIFYLTGIFTAIFGLNTFFVRFPAALFGALTVLPVYILTKILSRSKSISLLAAFLIAISPWHIVTSRATSEQIVALFLIIVGVIFVFQALRKEKRSYYIYAGINFVISYFFYHTPRVFVPIFLLLFSLAATYFPSLLSLKKRVSIKSILWALTLFMILVTVGLSLTKAGVGRLNQTSVWGDPNVQGKIKALSDSEKGNILAARIFDNKVVIYGRTIINEYLAYFSPEFLYISGGLPDRYVVPEMGLFYYIEFPILLLGAYFVLKRKDPFFTVPFIWLAIGPLAASVTTEDIPNVQRALFMLPAFQIIEAYGIYYGLSLLRPKWRYILSFVGVIAFILQIIYFWHMYVVVSPSHVSYRRDDGNEALFEYLQKQESTYQSIYLSAYQDLPLYYYYFAPNKMSLISYTQKDVDKGFSFGKYHFVPDECPERIISDSILRASKSLIVDFGTCNNSDDSLSTVNTITRQDSTTAYILKVVK